jgi:plastocyanin
VVWINNDTTGNPVAYQIMSSDNSNEIGSPVLNKGDTYSHMFNTTGTFAYYDLDYPAMTGSVMVQAGNGNAAGSNGNVQVTPMPVISSTTYPTTYDVNISSGSYSNPSLSINTGDTVVWTNMDTVIHTVASSYGGTELNSAPLNPGDTYSHTFNMPGSYLYYDSLYPDMTGAVVVGMNGNGKSSGGG